MKTFNKVLLFIFFCLLSCELPGPYRDIEISILNVDCAMINIYSFPDSNLLVTQPFNREYEKEIHISSVLNGQIIIKILSKEYNNIQALDTTIRYSGRFSWAAEF